MSEEAMSIDEATGTLPKSQALQTLTAPLSSSLSSLSGSSRTIPSSRDFHFYKNFDEFKLPILEIAAKSQSLLEAVGASNRIFKEKIPFPSDVDIDDAVDWLVNVNDDIYERFDASIDEFERIRKKEEETGSVMGQDTESGFQLVCGKKKKGLKNLGTGSPSGAAVTASVGASGVKVADKKGNTGVKPKVPFHIPTIKRPQEEYNILVNNSNQPFQHVWLERSEDGSRFIHPLEMLSVLNFVDTSAEVVEPVPPLPVERTPFKLVEEVQDLKELVAKLRGVNEFAVDLEHNHYRSFQGLTCLMQISTRTEDYIVDTLKLRLHVGPHMREVFKDPTKRKVMHGADRDVLWLQRDFGIYICNLFDTGQASRVLKLERNSLEFLLHHFCGITANKEYQNADWRLRPLPAEMLRYAREDTHYLLHVYDLMRVTLLTMPKASENDDNPLVEVYKRSYDVCMQLYERELLTESSYLYIYGLPGAGFNAQQLAVVAGLFEWRDVVARAEDESTGYILPNKTLLEIAKEMPVTTSKLRRMLKSKHPYAERSLGSIISIIRHSMQNASMFEAAAQHLKDGCVKTALQGNIEVNNGIEVSTSFTVTNLETGIAGNKMDGRIKVVSSQLEKEPLEHYSGTSKFGTDGQGDSFKQHGENGKVKIESSSFVSELPRESLNISVQNGDKNTYTSPSTKTTGATIQVLKKPTGVFGALLGSPAGKRKFDTDKKVQEEAKLEKIRSSVNLPFHSFLGRDELARPVVEQPTRVSEISHAVESLIVPDSSSNLEDIIILDDDSNAEEEPTIASEISHPVESLVVPAGSSNLEETVILDDDSNTEEKDDSETTNAHRDDNSVGEPLKMDEEDEPVSLSDLSTSFQKCFQSSNQDIKSGKPKKSEEPSGLLQLKPFDYAAARKQVKFGEDAAEESEAGDDDNQKGLHGSGGRRKSSAVGKSQNDDGNTEFLKGKRRQAFPASGNRSATFC